jgi:hypothetical protein
VRGWDLNSASKKPGDARVCFEHALPPSGFRYDLVESTLGHGSILDEPQLAAVLTHAVRAQTTAAD